MKNLVLTIILILVLFSCNKRVEETKPFTPPDDVQLINEQRNSFFAARKKPLPPNNPHNNPNDPPPPPGDTTATGKTLVIYLDFNGQDVSNTYWNTSFGVTNVSASSMTQTQIDNAVARSKSHWARFNWIEVTTDEQRFYSFPAGRRIRVVITDSWQWYGYVGGVAYLGSVVWDETTCFVFGSLNNNDEGYVSHAMSHEASHTFGNRHQSLYSNECVKQDEYRSGVINGRFAPGIVSIFIYGQSSICCTCYQDDVAIINSYR